MPSSADALHLREGLPADLLVLHGEWPRALWPTLQLHPVAAHWLEVHGWFRGLIGGAADQLRAIREQRLEPARGILAVRQQLRTFLRNLHHHHHAESSMAFPSLATVDPRLERGFALLDRDHDAIALLLGVLEQAAAKGELDALTLAVDELMTPLERHLLDEEDLVVPLLSAHRPPGW